ncbi:MAG: hypothetical protein M3387_01745 [Actinomycetota bacterium]|nr:hypothetical protein [Actinomycetota bacterium]
MRGVIGGCRSLVSGVVVAAVGYGLLAVAARGGVIVRDERGCPRSVGSLASPGWAGDAVRVHDATYRRIEQASPDHAPIQRSQFADKVGVVRCAIADVVKQSGYELRNGEAIFLEPGTSLYALVDTNASFRIAATDDGTPAVYEHRNRLAGTGAELLPFPTKAIVAVRFDSAQDGITGVGRITDHREVTTFVAELMSARVDPDAARDLPEGPRNFVALEFEDQPPVTLVIYPDQAVTTDGLLVPDEILKRLPAPT